MKFPVILGKSYKSNWFTLHGVEKLLSDPVVVSFVLNYPKNVDLGSACEVEEYIDDQYGYRECYGDLTDLKIEWIEAGRNFKVIEEDGWEKLIIT